MLTLSALQEAQNKYKEGSTHTRVLFATPVPLIKDAWWIPGSTQRRSRWRSSGTEETKKSGVLAMSQRKEERKERKRTERERLFGSTGNLVRTKLRAYILRNSGRTETRTNTRRRRSRRKYKRAKEKGGKIVKARKRRASAGPCLQMKGFGAGRSAAIPIGLRAATTSTAKTETLTHKGAMKK